MPGILRLIGDYDGVLHRHESIAGNLGACPLGPILVKRFERLFDGPPRVLKSHGKDPPVVTWLDVVEFAKNKPEQFNLEKTRNGVRVCQFYTKQCRVEISEEDFVLIASGMPQKMIPPQPIVEDEEKELGALEILEKNLQQIIQMADQGESLVTSHQAILPRGCLHADILICPAVSARARQLNHRLKNRRTAIISRRENDATLRSQQARSISPAWRDLNGNGQTSSTPNVHSRPHSPPSGFVAVNTNKPGPIEPLPDENPLSSQFMFSHSNAENITIINGTSIKGASPTTRAELMKKFFTTADRQARGYEEAPSSALNRPLSRPRPRGSDPVEYSIFPGAPGTVAIPNTPSSLLPPPKSNHYERDDGGPFKLEMVARMEELQRGERILPPCDRCRRLHMDCLKNLTACMGCTKKHAKCSWKDVKEEELQEIRLGGHSSERMEATQVKDTSVASSASTPASAPAFIPPPSSGYEQRPEPEPERGPDHNFRSDSAPGSAQPSEYQNVHSPIPRRRAVSDAQDVPTSRHDRRISFNRDSDATAQDDDDPGANQRLMQAIMDTVDHHTKVATAVKEREGDLNDRERERKMVKA